MKKLVSLLLAGLTLFSLASCSGGGSGTAAPQNSGTGEGGAVRTLTVANWQGYGSDAEYAVQAFEEANNCKVVHQYFDSEEALLNMLRQGGLGQIDVVLPNMAYVAIGKRENLFQPIDVSRLENYSDLREDIRDVEDVKDADGNILGVPWTWGTTSLGYNPDAISDTVDSWGILWDPAYQNKIAFFDDHTTAVMIAATYAGEDPYDPDLDVVKDTLLSLKANCKLFWPAAWPTRPIWSRSAPTAPPCRTAISPACRRPSPPPCSMRTASMPGSWPMCAIRSPRAAATTMTSRQRSWTAAASPRAAAACSRIISASSTTRRR